VPAGLDVLLVEQEVVGTEQSALEARCSLFFPETFTLNTDRVARHLQFLD
jgi:hypothetical protein